MGFQLMIFVTAFRLQLVHHRCRHNRDEPVFVSGQMQQVFIDGKQFVGRFYDVVVDGPDLFFDILAVAVGIGFLHRFNAPEAYTAATPLGEAATEGFAGFDCQTITNAITGLIPGSIGETSVIAIALGAILLLWTGVASWKIMCSVFVGGGLMGWLMQVLGLTEIEWWHHFVLGGFAFGAVFMATDPVTAARTETGKYFYGCLIGIVAVMVRVLNPGYPEGMMLAILLMNLFAPLIDYCVVERNISMRAKRATKK